MLFCFILDVFGMVRTSRQYNTVSWTPRVSANNHKRLGPTFSSSVHRTAENIDPLYMAIRTAEDHYPIIIKLTSAGSPVISHYQTKIVTFSIQDNMGTRTITALTVDEKGNEVLFTYELNHRKTYTLDIERDSRMEFQIVNRRCR